MPLTFAYFISIHVSISCDVLLDKIWIYFLQARSYLDWLQSLKQFFITVPYHILVASLTLMTLIYSSKQLFTNVSYHILVATCSLTLMALIYSLKQFVINVSYHILVASLTLMALF